MHIPDGFLSAPVWGALDAAAIASVALVSKKHADTDADASRIPFLGVMGAFVFAAQMVNFPVAAGTSGHLLGGALLGIVLGPRIATLVMAAVIFLQALILQDGGILALGANILNMAVAGVWLGYAAYRVCGFNKMFAVFSAGFISVAGTSALVLCELYFSGVNLTRGVVWTSTVLFLFTGLIEGTITVAVVRALERMNPGFVKETEPLRFAPVVFAMLGLITVLGIAMASSAPDALETALAVRGGQGPGQSIGQNIWSQRTGAGIGGMLLIFLGCTFAGRLLNRRLKQGSA